MPNLQIAPKLAIINSAEQFPLKFHKKQADGSFRVLADDAAAADKNGAERIELRGYAEVTKAALVSVTGTKGIAPRKHVQRIFVGAVTDAAAAAGSQATVRIQVKSNNLQSEFQGPFARYQKGIPLLLEIRDGNETAATLAQQIKRNIDLNAQTSEQFISASDPVQEMGDTDNNATTPDAPTGRYYIDITTKWEGVELDAKVDADDRFKAAVSITDVVQVQEYEGRGTYRQLNVMRLETPARTYPYALDTAELPQKGARYSSYLITFKVERPDLAGGAHINQSVGGEFQLQAYINESAAGGLITALAAWLNANAPVKLQYTATTADAALAQPETTTATIA